MKHITLFKTTHICSLIKHKVRSSRVRIGIKSEQQTIDEINTVHQVQNMILKCGNDKKITELWLFNRALQICKKVLWATDFKLGTVADRTQQVKEFTSKIKKWKLNIWHNFLKSSLKSGSLYLRTDRIVSISCDKILGNFTRKNCSSVGEFSSTKQYK